MSTKDLSEVKNKIIDFLKNNGPSLPAAIARHIQTDMIFASAFLSELLSEKRLKITNMKVGSSPVYYLNGQEEKLQSFAEEFLKSKEKDAFERLREKRVLKDSNQEPAIRVALREIDDFAFPQEKEGEIYWKYFLEKEIKFHEKNQTQDNKNEKKEINEDSSSKENSQEKENKEIEKTKKKEKSQIESKKPKTKKKKTTKKNSTTKDEKFFNNVKEYLKFKNREIEDIINFNKNELILKIKENENEKIVIAFNKKRVTESDITRLYKKISNFNLEYYILSLGEPAKKTENLIESIQKLKKFEKFE